ncbi:hypothetical protein F7734_53550 [Scytonema sp. UIC 10036]|uniref:hypothetical protein n=1 Tax=Scytonema sp. UIC 10036 TaxID=2304196 RepID=UPI0012DA30F7|nr:hypothetical protein [Scytonema sp. UIC 10036]MUH00634.1 hypothetical protein [Scytonema sp. UIC 10036]
MTEPTPNDAPSPESQEVAEKFSSQLENFQWRGDYFKFCEVLGLTPDDYAESHYQRFVELADALSHFRVDELAKILDAGK